MMRYAKFHLVICYFLPALSLRYVAQKYVIYAAGAGICATL